MRILHFYRTYFPDTIGGAEQSIYHLCRAGAKLGVDNTVLTLTRQTDGPASIQLPDHVVERSSNNFRIASVELSSRVLRRFRELGEQADVIHLHFPWPMADIAHLVTHLHKPTVVTYHADIQRQRWLFTLYRPLMQRFLHSVDRIVATSPQYAATSPVLRKHYRKVSVVPLGIDRAIYPTPDDDLKVRWSERIGGPFFLFVGVFRYYKGLPTLIEAAARTAYPLVVAGDGPLAGEIRALAARFGATNVTFVGQVSEVDKMALLELSTAVILPSTNRAEAFGISLLEAAMMGKPMISCEIGTGTSHINAHRETGLVVPPGDAHALADAMRELWKSPILRQRLGRGAAARFDVNFTADRTAAAYERIYREVAAGQRSGARAPHAAPQPAARPRTGPQTQCDPITKHQ
ncbi:glycosyltransferase [Burkholderia guangdongensis]|uniref:glycosyltransferase n=1 Tax=Burkholderia guangdongensis TaxID=1792500 RepID=UPI0015C91EAA|nr:glycosyltransferase [Burkholderia guangdongensis]